MPRDPRDSVTWRRMRKVVLARDGHTCVYCGQPADTVDHIISIKKNPELAFSLENLVSACRSCNSAKGSRSHGVFLQRQLTPPVFPKDISPMRADIQKDAPFSAPNGLIQG